MKKWTGQERQSKDWVNDANVGMPVPQDVQAGDALVSETVGGGGQKLVNVEVFEPNAPHNICGESLQIHHVQGMRELQKRAKKKCDVSCKAATCLLCTLPVYPPRGGPCGT